MRSQIGLPTLAVTSEQLRRQPHADNVRLVWACRDYPVAVADRIRVFDFLAEKGPVTLVQAAGVVQSAADGVEAVQALA